MSSASVSRHEPSKVYFHYFSSCLYCSVKCCKKTNKMIRQPFYVCDFVEVIYSFIYWTCSLSSAFYIRAKTVCVSFKFQVHTKVCMWCPHRTPGGVLMVKIKIKHLSVNKARRHIPDLLMSLRTMWRQYTSTLSEHPGVTRVKKQRAKRTTLKTTLTMTSTRPWCYLSVCSVRFTLLVHVFF